MVRLYFKTIVGQVMTVDLSSLNEVTIADVKRAVCEAHSIPASFLRLMFSGAELLDHQLATTCGVCNGAVIQIMLRQHQPNTDDVCSAVAGDIIVDLNALTVAVNDEQRLFQVTQLGDVLNVFVVIDLMTLALWLNIIPLMLAYAVIAIAVPIIIVIIVYLGLHRYNWYLWHAYIPVLTCCIGFRIVILCASSSQPFVMTLMVMSILIDVYLIRMIVASIYLNPSQITVVNGELLDNPTWGQGAVQLYVSRRWCQRDMSIVSG